MRKNNVTLQESRTNFFNSNKDVEVDDYTFKIWKSELQKELPSFWESINKAR